MAVDTEAHAEAFRSEGYVRFPRMFSAEEVRALRETVQRIRERERRSNSLQTDPRFPKVVYIQGDLLAHRELESVSYVLFEPRVLACARRLLGERLVYFGDSSLQLGEGARGFHRDNVDRKDPAGPDWTGEYGVLRFGLYLQDHSRHSGGLKLRPRSHRQPNARGCGAVDVDIEPGDLLAWSLKMVHSGNNVRLRGFPRLCLHPRVERFVPSFLRVPEEAERFAVFFTYGAPGLHVDRFMSFLGGREDYREHWRRCYVNPSILERARALGIEIRTSIAGYGDAHAETLGTAAGGARGAGA